MKDETLQITIGRDEAFVLFQLLVDYFDSPSVIVKDEADRMALSALGGVLERTLSEPFLESWPELVETARMRLAERSGER